MRIKRVESTSCWPFKVPILILGFYFLIVLPCTQFFFRTYPWLYKYADILFFSIVVIFALYKTNPAQLGFATKYLNQHLVLGLITGGILLLSLPLLETGLEITDLTDHELFGENPRKVSYDLNFLKEIAVIVVLIPLIEQIFFTGFILQSLLKKINPILAIYTGGLIYTLAGFKLSLGTFGLGICTSLLYKISGTLYASILFHMSCVLGGVLLENVYPRIIIILGFLW